MPINLNDFPEYRPYTNIQPFTVRDGATYLLQLETLKDWIRDTLVPHIDSEITELANSWGANKTELQGIFEQVVTDLITQVDTAIAELTTLVNSSVASMGDSVEQAQAARDAAIIARNEAEGFADTAEGAVDASVTAILENPASAARIALDAIYATLASVAAINDILAGRLSEASLADAFADKASTIASLSGKVSATALADEITARAAGDTANAGEIAANTAAIGTNLTAINRLKDFFRSPAFLPISARKTSDTTLAIAGTMPENVIKVGSQYWLLYTSTPTGSQTALSLAYADSPKGPWTPYNGGTPILTSGSLAWETANYTNGGCLIQDGATFYLFYSSDTLVDADQGAIGVATASSITGPYTKQSLPILERGSAGQWDSRRVQEPSVIKMPDGTWLMAYMAETLAVAKGQSEKIGIATATNPLGPWTKAAGNPVISFGASGAFDVGGAADPSLFYEDGLYWCLYSGLSTLGAKPWQIGLAYATNPQGPWTRHRSKAVIPVGLATEADSQGAWRGAIFEENGIHHVTYGAIPDSGNSAAAVAKYAELSAEAVAVWRSDSATTRDTGWLTIVKAGDVATMPTLTMRVRRFGNVVSIRVAETVNSNSPGAKLLWTIPVGWRPEGWATAPCHTPSTFGPIPSSGLTVTPSQVQLVAGSTNRHYSTVTFLTTDDFPAGY